MEGNNESLDEVGLVPRSLRMVFDTLNQYEREDWKEIQVTISCFEIHIETVRDLLDPSKESAQIMTNQKFKPTEVEVKDY